MISGPHVTHNNDNIPSQVNKISGFSLNVMETVYKKVFVLYRSRIKRFVAVKHSKSWLKSQLKENWRSTAHLLKILKEEKQQRL